MPRYIEIRRELRQRIQDEGPFVESCVGQRQPRLVPANNLSQSRHVQNQIQVQGAWPPGHVPYPSTPGFDGEQGLHQSGGSQTGGHLAHRIDEIGLRRQAHRTRAIVCGTAQEPCVRQTTYQVDTGAYLGNRIIEIAAEADIGAGRGISRGGGSRDRPCWWRGRASAW